MTNWFVKTFKKRSAIRLYISFEDNRVLEFWRVLKNNLNIIDLGKYGAYTIDPERMKLTGKNIPTYFYVFGNAEPVDFKKGELIESYNPVKFKKALNSKVVTEIVSSTNANLLDMKTVIIILVIVASAAGVGYYLNGQIEILKNILVTP